MGIAASLLLIAAGAVLSWAVTAHASGINLHIVGIILLVVGIIGLILSLFAWFGWWEWRPWMRTRTVYRERGPTYDERGRRIS